MTCDFDRPIDRRNTNSLKYDCAAERGKPEGLLPLWVADMDFPAPDEVLEDLQKAVAHGIFGYTEARDAYYEAVIAWVRARYDLVVTKNEIVKTPGVVFALAQMVRAFTQPGDGVLIQTPVYYPFYHIVRGNGRKLVVNPLKYADGAYHMDFDDFEAKIKTEQVRLFLLCSPHNPVGRVWTRAELLRLDEICRAHKVLVVSDEIHADFVWQGHTHTCFATINEGAPLATAPSKTFNLAGLQVANVLVKDDDLRVSLKKEIDSSGYSQLGTMALIACQSAYQKGGPWLAELTAYLAKNIHFTREFLAMRLPKIKLVEPEGTYLLWLDFSACHLTQSALDERIVNGAGLWLDSGTLFGPEGEGFQRMNIACPRATLSEALERLVQEFNSEENT